ncbi:MAG TPA: hypothetical protein IAC02_02870 [Candidatus Coprovivens excrementavium]|nr:hypothetical protein [Candidatus Coprovivens excrementavium]
MKRETITIDITSDGLNLLHHKKITNYKLKSVDNFIIINNDLFIKEFTFIINSEKINNSLLTDNIQIIIDNSYPISYINYLETLFKDLSFNKIIFKNINSILKMNRNKIYVNISPKIIKIYYQQNVYNINIYFNKLEEILLLYLKELTSIIDSDLIIIFGKNKGLKNLASNIEKELETKIYIYSYPEKVPIRQLLQ